MRTICFTCQGIGSLPSIRGDYRVCCQFCNGYGTIVTGDTLLTPGLRGSIPVVLLQDDIDTKPIEIDEKEESHDDEAEDERVS